jgi:uncharacterized membrane protein
MTNSQRALVKVLQMIGFGALVGAAVTLGQIYLGILETAALMAVILLVYLSRCIYINERERLDSLDKLNRR